MNLNEYPDREMLFISLANRLAGELGTCLRQHPHASLVVPGGTTPGPMFENLSDADLDWPRVHVLLSDERWVPPDHARSNTRLVRERFFSGRARDAHFVPYWQDVPTPEDAADAIAQSLAPELPISVCVLGMGDDMSIASLVPGSDGLPAALAKAAPPILPTRIEGEPRLTLTAPVFQGAMSVHLLITGDDKRAALDRARRLSPEEAPVALVLGEAEVHWAP